MAIIIPIEMRCPWCGEEIDGQTLDAALEAHASEPCDQMVAEGIGAS